MRADTQIRFYNSSLALAQRVRGLITFVLSLPGLKPWAGANGPLVFDRLFSIPVNHSARKRNRT